MVENKIVTIGIDESGILSYIGPRAQIGAVSFLLEDLPKLEKEGIDGKDRFRRKDSREQQRITNAISGTSVSCESVPVEHELINDYRRRKLGRHEAECLILQDIAIYTSEQLSEKNYNVGRIVIDKPKKVLKPLEYYFDEEARERIEHATGAKVIVIEEADRTFIECTAAWIIAYSAFKREVSETRRKFGNLGSGHPSDKLTSEWLKEHYAGYRSFASIPHQADSGRIKQFSNRCFHIIDIRWRTPSDPRDIGRGLSSPYFVLKDVAKDPNGENLEYVNLRRELTINISIYEARCPGTWPNFAYEPCVFTDENGINGRKLAKGAEMCFDCRKSGPPMKCIFNPDCDGYQATCGFEDFGASFCGSLHANYLIAFNNIIKVGQTLYNNLGQRLLEQGASSALVYGINPNRQLARKFELSTAAAMGRNINRLKKIGINGVRQKAPKVGFLLKYFYENWNGSREKELLHNALRYLKSMTYMRNEECLLDEPIEINLLEDYKKPPIATFVPSSSNQVRGRIVGFRGHFLYIKSDEGFFSVDMDSLKHHIIRGELTYDRTD